MRRLVQVVTFVLIPSVVYVGDASGRSWLAAVALAAAFGVSLSHPMSAFVWCAGKIAFTRELRAEYLGMVRVCWEYGIVRIMRCEFLVRRPNTPPPFWEHLHPALLDPRYFLLRKSVARDASIAPLDFSRCGGVAQRLCMDVVGSQDKLTQVNAAHTLRMLLLNTGDRRMFVKCGWNYIGCVQGLDPFATTEFGTTASHFPGHVFVLIKHGRNEFQLLQSFLYQVSLRYAVDRGFTRIRTRGEIKEWLASLDELCTHTEWTDKTTELFALLTEGRCPHLEGGEFGPFFAHELCVATKPLTKKETEWFRSQLTTQEKA